MEALNELALFAGGGGGILGGKLLGWRTRCAVEIDPYCREILFARQRDGILEPFPIWDDVCTFDGKPWRGHIDIITGGFPCQDISLAGKGAGIEGERSGLWHEFARIIHEVRPRYAFVENSPALLVRGIDRVLGDLAEMGYDAEWCVLGAGDVGAPHIRKRIWILAYSNSHEHQGDPYERGGQGESPGIAVLSANTCGQRLPQSEQETIFREGRGHEGGTTSQCDRGPTQSRICRISNGLAVQLDRPWANEPPDVPRVAKGIPNRVGRLKALGNGQVPLTAALAFCILQDRLLSRL
jgi:DNA (cytosine-5)-methyltransferase 1